MLQPGGERGLGGRPTACTTVMPREGVVGPAGPGSERRALVTPLGGGQG